ncbi:hypothetical protein [Weissella confusa]|uniref:hypothetical protein n=1 Tax=Weissella confusa TaxID=1583 RepID=UPI0022FE1E05|nr:hypothetical protein [Weissella confusa]MDA5456805.1 hypothetical protein [Weissella confusa]
MAINVIQAELAKLDASEVFNDLAMTVRRLAYMSAKYTVFDKENKIIGYKDYLGKMGRDWLSLIDAEFDQVKKSESHIPIKWYASEAMVADVHDRLYSDDDIEIIKQALVDELRLGNKKKKRKQHITDENAGLDAVKVNKHYRYMIEHGYPRSLFAYDLMIANKESENIPATKDILGKVFLVWILEEQHGLLEKNDRDSDDLMSAYEHTKNGSSIKLLN